MGVIVLNEDVHEWAHGVVQNKPRNVMKSETEPNRAVTSPTENLWSMVVRSTGMENKAFATPEKSKMSREITFSPYLMTSFSQNADEDTLPI